MQVHEKSDIMLTVQDGWIHCPCCSNKRLKRLYPDETAENLSLFCRDCKTEIRVNIDKSRVLRTTTDE